MKPSEPEKRIEDIISDNTSGSKELLGKVVSFFRDNMDSFEFFPIYTGKLKSGLSEFPSVTSWLAGLKKVLNDRSKTERYISEYFNKEEKIYKSIASRFLTIAGNPGSFVTLSNSKTIIEVFRILKDKISPEIYICESRPMFEGRNMAEKLAEFGCPVTLIPDASAAAYVKNSDIVVTGADKILSDGTPVNKSGTLNLAITANYYNKPLYVLAESSKFTEDNDYTPVAKNSNEIWENSPHGIKIKNYYFEKIDKELVTKIISEK